MVSRQTPAYSTPSLTFNQIFIAADAGSGLPPARIREIRTGISAGTTIGPRVGAVAGAILEGAGGRVTPQFLPIANLTEARAAVIAHKESGADFVTVDNRLARDAYLAIVDEARRQGMPVAGHIPMWCCSTPILSEIRNTKRISAVVTNGRYLG